MSACNKSGNVTASADGGKIPVTTASDEARKEFLAGRDLSERLLGQESLQHFDKALALDPEFALAELGRANNSPTAKEFFEHLKKASALAPKASNGEKLLILANQAGANGVTEIQKEYLDQLTAAYPSDERAQFNLAITTSGSRNWTRRCRITRRRWNWRRIIRRPITCWAIATGRRATLRARKRRSRNISS
jgi:tetratricopeptide (TPR) repeat protein